MRHKMYGRWMEANKRGEGDTMSIHDRRQLRGKVLTSTKEDASMIDYHGAHASTTGTTGISKRCWEPLSSVSYFKHQKVCKGRLSKVLRAPNSACSISPFGGGSSTFSSAPLKLWHIPRSTIFKREDMAVPFARAEACRGTGWQDMHLCLSF